MVISSKLRYAAAVMASAVAACSPTFNWREIRVGDGSVIALLPCKPDRATRQVPLGSESVPVDVAGCKAGGATFAVAHASASTPEQADSWLRAWRVAARQQLAGSSLAETPAMVSGAAGSPAPVRLVTQGSESHAAAAHVLWFAQQRPDGVAVYQATIDGSPSSPDAVQTFFEGFRIP
jgi:hypothetical protein